MGRRGGRRKSYWMTLSKKGGGGIMEFERGGTRTRYLEKSLCYRLWTCCKTDYGMIESCLIFNTKSNNPHKDEKCRYLYKTL